ncbi:unnamed protein product [Lampetra fluviatilis]
MSVACSSPQVERTELRSASSRTDDDDDDNWRRRQFGPHVARGDEGSRFHPTSCDPCTHQRHEIDQNS